MASKGKFKYSIKHSLIVLSALTGMLFASFGPALLGSFFDDSEQMAWVEMADAEEESEESESRNSGSGSNRLLEEETKHFLELDFSYLEIMSGERHIALTMHDIGPDSQHHPSILKPPPKLG